METHLGDANISNYQYKVLVGDLFASLRLETWRRGIQEIDFQLLPSQDLNEARFPAFRFLIGYPPVDNLWTV